MSRVVILLSLGAMLVIMATAPLRAQPTEAVPQAAIAPPVAPANPPSSQRPALTFWQIVFSGGPLGIANMVALILLSIAALALAIDNLRVIRRTKLIPESLGATVRACVARGDVAAALSACQQQPSFLAAVVSQGLAEVEGGWSEIEKSLEDATAEQAARLFRRIEYLNVIGNIAPMVGLLGTVTGMLLAFKQVADSEASAGAAQLADGIYQALVTTVVGLIIAIPSLGVFALFRSRVDQLVAESAYAALHALAPLKHRGALPQPTHQDASEPPVQPPPLPSSAAV